MRIAQVATVSTPVRREGSASIEGLAWLLTRELVGLGHEVTLFATAGSESAGSLVATLPGPYGMDGAPDDWFLCEWINLAAAVERSGAFDVLHAHAYLWGLPLQPFSRAPIVHTLHVWPFGNEARARGMWPDACVTAVSEAQWRDWPGLRRAPVVPHAVDAAQFTLRTTPDDYLCFLGRMIPGKGPVAAVAAARALGMRLLLAGPATEYFRTEVAPLVDGRDVEYVGPVAGGARDALLGGARALHYPNRDPEPFGLVLVEAMMCGTPVAAVGVGAVDEVVDEGVTGCIAPTPAELAPAVRRALSLDRAGVRAHAERRFCARRMAEGYVRVYEAAIAAGVDAGRAR
jgi:glycosyltransferase involved in cell wall biosynthesis